MKREEAYLVFKVLFLQVLNISNHLMNDWIKHRLEIKKQMKVVVSSQILSSPQLCLLMMVFHSKVKHPPREFMEE